MQHKRLKRKANNYKSQASCFFSFKIIEMKSYVSSAILIAIGGFLLATQAPQKAAPHSYAGEVYENYTPTPHIRIQQAHLRGIKHQDMAAAPKIAPIPGDAYISSSFGMRLHPIHKMRMMHLGCDFAAPKGSPVIAASSGLVTTSITKADSSTYGKHVILGHDDVYWTLYAHLSKVFVNEGDIVEMGDTIGLVGNTGNSTNPHLHYEVLKGEDQKRLNPEKFF